MGMTDPIADLLTRIRNAASARKESVDVPWSRVKGEIVRVLLEEGYLRDHTVVEIDGKRWLRVGLKYQTGFRPVISGIRRVSKPSLRVYMGAKEIPAVRRGLGVGIVSTPEGVMSDRDARRRNCGGELLAAVW